MRSGEIDSDERFFPFRSAHFWRNRSAARIPVHRYACGSGFGDGLAAGERAQPAFSHADTEADLHANTQADPDPNSFTNPNANANLNADTRS